MKKLMVITAVALAACVGQAAQMSWASGKMYTLDASGNFTTTAAKDGWSAALYVLTAAQYSELTSVAQSDLAQTISSKASTYGTPVTGSTASKTSAVTLNDTTDYSVGDTAYAAILYTYKADNSFMIGNIGSYTFESANNGSVGNMGLYPRGDATSTPFTGASTGDVPEPTSGLLLLVGAGMLALRRKQK